MYDAEEEIHKLKIELAENQRERDMLSSELERIKSEFKREMSHPSQTTTPVEDVNKGKTFDDLMAEKTMLIDENEQLIKTNIQLSTLQQLIWEDDGKCDINSDNVVSKVLNQLEELNQKLADGHGRTGDADAGSLPSETKKANLDLKQRLDNVRKEKEKLDREERIPSITVNFDVIVFL